MTSLYDQVMLSMISRSVRAFSAFVLSPPVDRRIDVSLLIAFVATRQKQDDILTVSTEIYPITRSKVDPKLHDAGADGFRVRQIPVPHLREGAAHPHGGRAVEAVLPFQEGPASVGCFKASDLHPPWIQAGG
jgi:hypothetical protein